MPPLRGLYNVEAIRERDIGVFVNTRTIDQARWHRIDRDQLGISPVDPDGHKIGMNIAYRSGVGLNWYPADPYKQVLVGVVHHYGFYDPWGDEADWNIFIKPDPPFQFLIEDVLSNADIGGGSDDVHESETGEYLMEAEITPDEHFYDNPYFTEDDTSPLVGERVGVYGPWVMEEAHGWRPEIHPSEVIWWRQPGETAAETVWTIIVMQDDSNRFDRTDDFRGRVPRPWSAWPRRAVIDVAIRVPSGSTKTLQLSELYGRNVRNSDPQSRASVTGSYGNIPVLTLNKAGGAASHVLARFSAVEQSDDGSSLLAFLQLSVEVGLGDRGGEGYIVLQLRDLGAEPQIGPEIDPTILARRARRAGTRTSPAGPEEPSHYETRAARPPERPRGQDDFEREQRAARRQRQPDRDRPTDEGPERDRPPEDDRLRRRRRTRPPIELESEGGSDR